MGNDVKVNLPNELLEDMKIQDIVLSPSKPEEGILILTRGLYQFSNEIVIRIYRLKKDAATSSYFIYYELQAFMFTKYKQANNFLEKLPSMSAFEMLLLLNPKPQILEYQ